MRALPPGPFAPTWLRSAVCAVAIALSASLVVVIVSVRADTQTSIAVIYVAWSAFKMGFVTIITGRPPTLRESFLCDILKHTPIRHSDSPDNGGLKRIER
jgi:hypothetical protein